MKKILITLGLLLLVVVLKNNANAQEHGKWAIGHGDLTVDYVGSEWVFSFHHEDEDHDQATETTGVTSCEHESGMRLDKNLLLCNKESKF